MIHMVYHVLPRVIVIHSMLTFLVDIIYITTVNIYYPYFNLIFINHSILLSSYLYVKMLDKY